MRVQHTRNEPIWRLVELAAGELTKANLAPFTRQDLIRIVQRARPDCRPDSINPIIQGMTDNLRGGAPGSVGLEILHSVGRGQFVLRNGTPREIKPNNVKPKPTTSSRSTNAIHFTEQGRSRRRLGRHEFFKICDVELYRTDDGSLREFNPQPQYRNEEGLPLNRYGVGPFCSFRIPSNIAVSGVYAILVEAEARYLGECVNLSQRFNMGYGLISPRNCYKGGQETNCRINNLMLQAAKTKSSIELWFMPTEDYKPVEKELLGILQPAWNRR